MAPSKRFLAEIPDVFESPDHAYASPQEMQICLKALLAILGRQPGAKSNVPGYIIDSVEVEFSVDRKAESIWADHKNARLVILAPKRKNESEQSLHERRMKYLRDFATVLDELKTRGLTQVYRTLDMRAREALKTDYLRDVSAFAAGRKHARRT